MRMRTVIEIQNISRFTPVNATMSAAPFSASAMLAARMPSVRVRSPMARSGRLAIDSEAILHQRMTHERQVGFFAFALLGQTALRDPSCSDGWRSNAAGHGS